jgi:predicted nucleic acid-binding protein
VKALIDTNVVLDTLANREPYSKQSDVIFDLIAKENITGYIITSSVTDVYYLLRKTLSDTDSRIKIEDLLNLLEVIEVKKADCYTALRSSIKDYEDALIFVCADREELDFIVTRDEKFLNYQKVISPSKFLERMEL